MYNPPPPTNTVLGGKRLNLDPPTNQEPPQKKYKVEYIPAGYTYADYFSPFFLLTPDQHAQILVKLPLAEILSAATVSRAWSLSVKRALRLYCVLNYKLQWAPSVEPHLLRVYDDSWAKVLKAKKRLFEIVQDCDSQQSEGFAWDLDVHSMPFDVLSFQYLWNDALYLMWNESLNYTITSRKPHPADHQIDQCAACKVINEDDATELLLCDGCPKMFHLHCANLKRVPEGNFFCLECSRPGGKSIPDRFFNFTFVRDIKQETVDTLWASDAEDYSSSDEDEEEIDIEEPDQPIPEEPSEDSANDEEPYEFEDEEERDWIPDSRNQKPQNTYPSAPGMGIFPPGYPAQYPSYPQSAYFNANTVASPNFAPPSSFGSYGQPPLGTAPIGQNFGSPSGHSTYPSYPSSQLAASGPYSPYTQSTKPPQFSSPNQVSPLSALQTAQLTSPYLQQPSRSSDSNLLGSPTNSSFLPSSTLPQPFANRFPNQNVAGLNAGNRPNLRTSQFNMDSDDSDISEASGEELSPKKGISGSYLQRQQQQHYSQLQQQQRSLLSQQPLQSLSPQTVGLQQTPAAQVSVSSPIGNPGLRSIPSLQNLGQVKSPYLGMKPAPSHWPNPYQQHEKRLRQRPPRRNAHCFPFSRVGKLTGIRKFDREQIAEVLAVSYGVAMTAEELFAVDDDPDAKPNTSTPDLRRAFEVTFRFWNKQYGRLSYFPRAPFDLNCGALWLGNTLESIFYADTSDATVPYCLFLDAKSTANKKQIQPPPPKPHIQAPSQPQLSLLQQTPPPVQTRTPQTQPPPTQSAAAPLLQPVSLLTPTQTQQYSRLEAQLQSQAQVNAAQIQLLQQYMAQQQAKIEDAKLNPNTNTN